jgi:hypothetical protein
VPLVRVLMCALVANCVVQESVVAVTLVCVDANITDSCLHPQPIGCRVS